VEDGGVSVLKGRKTQNPPKAPDITEGRKTLNQLVGRLTWGTVLLRRDLPVGRRLRWALAQTQARPDVLKALKKESKEPRYDDFYSVDALWQHAVKMARSGGVLALRNASIVLLRCTTLARSGDVANMLPTLFFDGTRILVRCIAKGAVHRAFVISGVVYETVGRYLLESRGSNPLPSAAMFLRLGNTVINRYGHEQNPEIGSERVAKICLEAMHASGIDTDYFKAHSLRGACATAAVLSGVSPHTVRLRGGWRGDASFDLHYGRAHQGVDWCAAVGGLPVAGGDGTGPSPPC
jgi:integrase